MIKQVKHVTKVALALPPRSRAKLAERLLASLDRPRQKQLDALWADEAERRIQAFEDGKLAAVPAAEVFRQLRSRKRP